jgi:hypothetical protein
MHVDFNKMTVLGFCKILNEALKPLAGTKYKSKEGGFSSVHAKVINIISDLLPKELEAGTWLIRHKDHYELAMFEYEIDDTTDKRFEHRNQGTVNKVKVVPCQHAYDSLEQKKLTLMPPHEGTTMQEWKNYIHLILVENNIEKANASLEEQKQSIVNLQIRITELEEKAEELRTPIVSKREAISIGGVPYSKKAEWKGMPIEILRYDINSERRIFIKDAFGDQKWIDIDDEKLILKEVIPE